jgi:hypothetical protein
MGSHANAYRARRHLPRLKQARRTQVWVQRMLGNHGPSCFRRYPKAFARFLPDCRDDDLRKCSLQEAVNAYDNALLYTDHASRTEIPGAAKVGQHRPSHVSANIACERSPQVLPPRTRVYRGRPRT